MATEALNDHARLFAAAERILEAIESDAGMDASLPMYLGPLLPGDQPPAHAFTQDELIEALELLRRLGVLPDSSPHRAMAGRPVQQRRRVA